MKKWLVILAIFFTNCKENKPTVASVPEESNLIKSEKLSRRIFTNAEIADQGKISRDELDMVTLPLEDSLEKLFLILTPTEQSDLNAYRAKLLSQMADRKVERENK